MAREIPMVELQNTVNHDTVQARGILGVEMTTGGATLYAVVEANQDFRVYAGPQGSPCDGLVARGNLSTYKEV